jgi:hypothetical protein
LLWIRSDDEEERALSILKIKGKESDEKEISEVRRSEELGDHKTFGNHHFAM